MTWSQDVWYSTNYANWTRKLIPNKTCCYRTSGISITYHQAQFLTGHGCFNRYLQRMGKKINGACVYCGTQDDTADRWDEERRYIAKLLRRDLTPEDVEYFICDPEETFLPDDQSMKMILLEKTRHQAEMLAK